MAKIRPIICKITRKNVDFDKNPSPAKAGSPPMGGKLKGGSTSK